jgi:hypothetical protein
MSQVEDQTLAVGKKRKIEEVNDAMEEELGPSKNDPMPYTCICFKGKFYTTDTGGHFVHNVADANNKVALYRCESTPQGDVVFTFIRNLSESEMLHLENDWDVNVIANLEKNNKSLFY